MDPLFSLPIATLLIFVLGVLTYKLIIKHVINALGLTALLAAFGFSLILRNLALFLWSPNYRFINNAIVTDKKFQVGSVIIGMPQLVASLGSIIMTVLIYNFVTNTKTGRAIQATALDRQTAVLMGIDTEKIYAITFGIGGACVGVAGALMSTIFPVYPEAFTAYWLL